MKPIFCGNFDYDARQSDLERLFRKYGKVDRVDMKSGFAFVYMEDERDAEDAIRGLDRFEFGRKGRRLRVEWTKQERGVRRPGNSRRSSTNSRPSKTLFVINFDPYHTRTRDLERHFDPYGKILNVRIRRNFAFIQYESEEDASRALDATNMSKLMDRVISVEFAIKDDDERRNGYSPDRSRDRSPGRRGHERGRSPSPYRRERGSPDYGRGRSPSPYRRERASPDYGRGPSLSPYKKERSNSDYDRRHSQSRRERPSLDHGHERSPRERVTPDYGSGRSPSTKRERTSPDDYRRGPSPQRKRISPDDYRLGPSPSPQRERISPDDYRRSSTPQREGISPDDYRRGPSPDSKPELKDSPNYNGAESPMEDGYRSRSPLERERSRSRS
ncbi:Serine/arginine-rich splicing factor like [Actinidia chinensis var. chinensis]|uniref:Serine/arginine-rich splicing factor like n=1 Tax=Actinidia chinensis var. chinensis TaxID=1590841 RepID=A0A2R6RWE7_ACTCC|nr:Serine/arginine-rich splicing factor like [Actinidia chinensis var. chinensis]